MQYSDSGDTLAPPTAETPLPPASPALPQAPSLYADAGFGATPPPPPPPPAPPWGFSSGPVWQPLPQRPTRRRRGVAAALAGLFALGLGSGVVAEHLVSDPSTPSTATILPSTPTNTGTGTGAQTAPSTGTGSGTGPATANIDPTGVAAKVTPGIVNINVTLGTNGAAAGTGMVITSTGEVLTNNHVVDGETSMTVELPSTGRTYSAHVLGYDLTEDIALVQIDGGGSFRTVSVGNSSTVTAGQAVVALGNALGRNGAPSVTTGSVTRLDQTITASDQSGGDVETVSGLIEIDAQIQPGDSGGPLVTSSGTVIGMDTAAQSGGGADQQTSTLAYAIPINKAMQVVRQVQSGRTTSTVHVGSTRALLGVGAVDGQGGVQVNTVESGSPAANSGITVGSVITALGGSSVDTNATLRNLIVQHEPGSSVRVTWTDPAGASHTASVVLASGPPA